MKGIKNILLFGLIIIFCSCGSYKSTASYSTSDKVTAACPTFGENSNSTGDDSFFDDSAERKIIYNAILTLTVKNCDTANIYINKIAKKYDGYVQNIGTTYTQIRVKAENLDFAIAEISKLGKIESKSINGEDVTETYLDYDIRLENAEKARTRYLELLDSAANVTETLLVEKELERLNGEIELLKGKMSKIEHLTEYSTISIYLKEKVKPGILGYVFIASYKAVKWLFVRN